jgi:cellulose 1,4-beta-cellobiosidase
MGAGHEVSDWGAGFERAPSLLASGAHQPAHGLDDAYVWIKPPGESDGSSTAIPNDEGKGFDQMCDPTYGGNSRNGNSATGALPSAPLAGAWFGAMLQQLMQNAYPPL